MDFRNYSLKQLHEMLLKKELSVTELTKKAIENAKKHLDSNFLITLIEDKALAQAKELENKIEENNLLCAIPYITKDNIWTKDILTTSGSKILSNFYPPNNATITNILEEENKTILIGKAALDELAMGGTGLYSFNGYVRNPNDSKRIIGGSSSGSAYAVATGVVPFATGTDTGDSIRKPASYAGIVGFKPTYGSISRYGVMPYAPSLDHVGYFTNNVEDMAYLCDKSFKYDSNDFTSIQNSQPKMFEDLELKGQKIKFGFLKDVEKYMTGQIHDEYQKFCNKLRKEGHELINLDFNKALLDCIPAVYMTISFAEAVSMNANLDGVNFGKRVEGKDYIDLIKKSRTEGFGLNVKRRFIFGSYELKTENQERLLLKSKKVRRLIVEELEKVFNQVDILIFPPSLDPAPLIEQVLGKDIEERNEDVAAFLQDLLILANFNGMPSITLPFIKIDNMPLGINLNAKPKQDHFLLKAAKYVEDLVSRSVGEDGSFNE